LAVVVVVVVNDIVCVYLGDLALKFFDQEPKDPRWTTIFRVYVHHLLFSLRSLVMICIVVFFLDVVSEGPSVCCQLSEGMNSGLSLCTFEARAKAQSVFRFRLACVTDQPRFEVTDWLWTFCVYMNRTQYIHSLI
jgi:hypothetical protein